MAVTYYVALPFLRTEDGVAPGEAQEMPDEKAPSGAPSRCPELRPMPARSPSGASAMNLYCAATKPQKHPPLVTLIDVRFAT
jgi:hypothetical protein